MVKLLSGVKMGLIGVILFALGFFLAVILPIGIKIQDPSADMVPYAVYGIGLMVASIGFKIDV